MQHPNNRQRGFFEVLLNRNGVPHIPGQRQDEEIRFYFHQHWILLVPTFFFMLVLLTAVLCLNFFVLVPFWWDLTTFQQGVALSANSVFALMWTHIFFIRILHHFMRVTVVTNRRVVHFNDTTVFRRESDSITLDKIQDTIFYQTPFGRLLRYGNITIHNSSGSEVFALTYVPYPEKHCNHINYVYHEHSSSNSENEVAYGSI